MKVLLACLFVLAAPAAALAQVPTGNLVANPGFEFGPSSDSPVPGWVNDSPTGRVLRYDTATAAAPAAGCRGYTGPAEPSDDDDSAPNSSTYSVHQEIALPAAAAGKTLRYSARLGRAKNNDYGALQVAFLDSDKEPVGTAVAKDGQTATAGAFTTAEGTATVPTGAGFVSVGARSVAPQLSSRPDGPAGGFVDNVKLTFDAALPADPAAGCQQPIVTTGDAGRPGINFVDVNGTVETRGETVSYLFRFGEGSKLDRTTNAKEIPGAEGVTPVTANLGPLDPGTKYSYQLVAHTVGDGTAGPDVAGAVKTVTSQSTDDEPDETVKLNKPKKALKVKGPTGGCFKAGRSITVTAADKAAGNRPLTQFQVGAYGGQPKRYEPVTFKLFKGKLGKPKATLKITKPPKQGYKKSVKLKLVIAATFGAKGGQPSDAVHRTVRIRYC